MSTNFYEFNDKTAADNSDRDQSADASETQRRRTASEFEFAQGEHATPPGHTDNVDSREQVGNTDSGSTGINNYHIGKRLLFVTVLAICYFVVEFLAKIVTVAQFLFVVWKKQPHPEMQRLGTTIAVYMHDLWRYCTFASDDPPWPFPR